MKHPLQSNVRGLHAIPTPTPFPVGPANIYLYKGDEVCLFDSGTNTTTAFNAFMDGLTQLGVSIKDISKIILTHHHLDHIGLSRKIRDISGATVYAHPAVPEQISMFFNESYTRPNLERVLFELGLPESLRSILCDERHHFHNILDDFIVDKTLNDGQLIGPFRVLFRPGHSVADTLYVHDSEKWALTGDHLIYKITSNPLLRRQNSQGHRAKSLVQYRDSLLKTRELDINWCFAGHNQPFQNHRNAIDQTLHHLEQRNKKILGLIKHGPSTVYEVTQRLFPHLSEPHLYYCLSAATGHLELLEEQGRVSLSVESGVFHYSLSVDSDS